jgi:hypothetical protein
LYQHLAAAPPNIRICPLRARSLLAYRLVATGCGGRGDD